MAQNFSYKVFDEKTIQALGYYVYILLNPKDHQPFYVGKGEGNRVFDHIRDAVKNPKITTDKYDMIRDIGPDQVEHIIVTHGIKTEEEAFRIETVLIDVLEKIGTLTNRQLGHNANSLFGMKTADEIIRMYSADPLCNIGDDCVIININENYDRAMCENSIFEATKGTWKMAEWRTKKIKYVLSEYRGLIVEVFEVTEWYKQSRPYGPKSKKYGQVYDGFAFEGKVAGDNIRNKYINKSVKHKKIKGRSNPIMYNL